MLEKQKITILGGGESGVGAAILAQKKGFEVFVSDKGQITNAYKKVLNSYQIAFEEQQHSEDRILASDLIIKSPGIPDKVALIKKIKKAKIEIIDEIEFGSRYTTAKIIAITGSNGKTTTTNLVYHLLKEAGLNVGIGGNIGYSFAKQVAENDFDIYALELSSFQLDYTKKFKPNISILLNITPDHLDRYEYKMENYTNSKFRIIQKQRRREVFIYNGEDKVIRDWLFGKSVFPKQYPIYDNYFQNEKITVFDSIFKTTNTPIQGKHNLFNATCAITAAKILGVTDEKIEKALKTFKNHPHRLELVRVLNDITYINDSKATNVDAVYYALDAMKKPVVWVVGGTDKGNDYTQIADLVEEKVKAIVCLGVDNSRIITFFSPMIKIIEETQDVKEAITIANKYAENGDVVLLSPACASFDLFKNYMDRGEQFKETINNLKS